MTEIAEKTNTNNRNLQLDFTSKTELGLSFEQEIVSSSANEVDTNPTVSQAKPNTEVISEPKESLSESISSPEKLIISDRSKQRESKQEGKPAGEDFCFSDEEDESIIPRAIGDQVDRIEVFLKNERLRLSKKRKSIDE